MSIYDNKLTRDMAKWLEHDHSRRLGSHATMAIARAFNSIKNRRQVRTRRGLYAAQLDELLLENGPAPSGRIKMKDGWAWDDTKSLPHLDRLLADSEEIIKERGGVNRGGGDRAHFQQIMNDEHLRRYPSILDFATSNEVLMPVMDYLGFIPTLSVMKPLGVRLNESDIRFAPADDGVFRESQLFHCDYQDNPLVYVIVTLREVTIQSGPFSILPAGATQRARKALRYGKRGSDYRVTDEEMYKHVDRSELLEQIAPAGTVLFMDSSNCFHYGSRHSVIPRYLMMYAYVSAARCDFGDLLRKERPEPVLDDAARLHRTHYPLKKGDPKLRRLLLDPHYK